AGFRIERTDGAVAFFFLLEGGSRTSPPAAGASAGAAAGGRRVGSGVAHPLLPRTRVVLPGAGAVVVPRRHVEEPRARTVRGRIPVGAALRAGIDEDAAHWLGPVLRVLDRPALLVDAVAPRLLDERLAQEKLPRHAVEHVEEPVAIRPE